MRSLSLFLFTVFYSQAILVNCDSSDRPWTFLYWLSPDMFAAYDADDLAESSDDSYSTESSSDDSDYSYHPYAVDDFDLPYVPFTDKSKIVDESASGGGEVEDTSSASESSTDDDCSDSSSDDDSSEYSSYDDSSSYSSDTSSSEASTDDDSSSYSSDTSSSDDSTDDDSSSYSSDTSSSEDSSEDDTSDFIFDDVDEDSSDSSSLSSTMMRRLWAIVTGKTSDANPRRDPSNQSQLNNFKDLYLDDSSDSDENVSQLSTDEKKQNPIEDDFDPDFKNDEIPNIKYEDIIVKPTDEQMNDSSGTEFHFVPLERTEIYTTKSQANAQSVNENSNDQTDGVADDEISDVAENVIDYKQENIPVKKVAPTPRIGMTTLLKKFARFLQSN